MYFFFSSRRRHTRYWRDWSSDVCSSDLGGFSRMRDPSDQLQCSFCGKSQRQVRKLIAGPGVYICDECIELCNEIIDRKSTRLNSSHANISYAVFCLKKKITLLSIHTFSLFAA